MEPDTDEEDDVDWDAISQCADEMEIPESENSGPKDAKKVAALERLEELFDKELFEQLLPAGTEVSGRAVSLNGIPSAGKHETGSENTGSGAMGILETAEKELLVSKYIPLYFGSFTDGTGEAELLLIMRWNIFSQGKNQTVKT